MLSVVFDPNPRPDLLRGLIQSCYVIDSARAAVQRRWGGDFESRDAEATTKRVEAIGKVLDARGFRRPDEVVGPHTEWFAHVCGAHPEEVPLGAAVLHQFSKWSDMFLEPYLDDIDSFRELGRVFTRVDMEMRLLDEEETIIEKRDLPSGRRFVILTDVHLGSAGREMLAKIAIDDINEIEPEFVVIPGDITEDGEPDQFRLAKETFDRLNCPYYVVLGNHDVIQRSTREAQSERFYKEAFGEGPQDFHVVECGDLQIALVDSTDPVPSPFPDWDMARGSVGGVAAGTDSGALRPGQAEAVAAAVDPKRPMLLVQHHELHPFPGMPPVKFALREEDAAAELDALSGHNLLGVVAGHTHRSAVLKVGNDAAVTQLEIPSLKDWPFTYSVAGVTDSSVQVVVRQISDPAAVWDVSKGIVEPWRRFVLSHVGDLAYTFSR